MTLEVRLELAYVPPSLNEVASKGGHWKWTKAKRAAHDVMVPALEACGLGAVAGVYVEGEVTFPTRVKRDQGNYRSTLEKFLGDALQLAGILADDDWASYEFGDLAYNYERGVRRTRLVLMAR